MDKAISIKELQALFDNDKPVYICLKNSEENLNHVGTT